MNVIVDVNEPEERFEAINNAFPNSWEIRRERLKVGDYLCGSSVVEWKTTDVASFERMYEQARAMVNAYPNCHLFVEKTFPQAVGTIVHNRKVSKFHPYGLFASISAMGVKVWFVSNKVHGFRLMKSIFEKDNSAKDPAAIPVRAQRYKDNPVVQSYMAYPGVGEKRALQLYELFPIPARLHKMLANLGKRDYKWFKEKGLTKFKAVLTKIYEVEYGHWQKEEDDEDV